MRGYPGAWIFGCVYACMCIRGDVYACIRVRVDAWMCGCMYALMR